MCLLRSIVKLNVGEQKTSRRDSGMNSLGMPRGPSLFVCTGVPTDDDRWAYVAQHF